MNEHATFSPGQSVVDREGDNPNDTAVVIRYGSAPASETTIETDDGEATVADFNPEYPAADAVVVVSFKSALDYAFGSSWWPHAGHIEAFLDEREEVPPQYAYPASRLRPADQ